MWLVVCTKTGETAAVDGPEAGPVLAYCQKQSLRLTTILNTHTHGDHVGINRELERRGELDSYRVVGPRRAADAVPGLDEAVDEDDNIAVGAARARVMSTEGHLDGHISYVFDGALFCGDTLFGGGCGYLFDGPPAKMFASLTRLAALAEETLVFCAHEYTQDNLRFAWSIEPDNAALAARIRQTWSLRANGRSSVPSTIALESATNPFLRTSSPTLVEHLRKAWPGRELNSPLAVFTAARELKDRKDYKSLPDSMLPI